MNLNNSRNEEDFLMEDCLTILIFAEIPKLLISSTPIQ